MGIGSLRLPGGGIGAIERSATGELLIRTAPRAGAPAQRASVMD
jgi:hypothetical protein